MARRGRRFELDLDADNFTAKLLPDRDDSEEFRSDIVREIKERNPTGVPAPPRFKATITGFPEHKKHISTFKQRQLSRNESSTAEDSAPTESNPISSRSIATRVPPSDRAIAHHVSKKHGYDFEAQQKAEISDDNKRRIAEMSQEDIEEARADLMSNLNPAFIERLLRKANIDDNLQTQPRERSLEGRQGIRLSSEVAANSGRDQHPPEQSGHEEVDPAVRAPSTVAPPIHFPVPPRSASSFVPLNPDDPNFLEDLRTHYFPETPHDPSSLSWLQDPSSEENEDSPYNPNKDAYPTSSLRFSFVGKLIPPQESLEIDVSKGLHHHGLAPSSAGYTIPELAILSRSKLPNQRCIAFQVLGRMLFRLGRGDFGPRGSELQEGLWLAIEHERVVEITMREANRDGGHMSAKAYATEALWLWKKGGGGDRGLLKEGEKIAK